MTGTDKSGNKDKHAYTKLPGRNIGTAKVLFIHQQKGRCSYKTYNDRT